MRHGRQRRFGIDFRKFIQQWPRPAHRPLHLPKRIAAMKDFSPRRHRGTEEFYGHGVRLTNKHVSRDSDPCLSGHRAPTCIQRADFRQRRQLVFAQLRYAASQILNGSKRRQTALPNQCLPRRLAQPARIFQPKAN